MDNNYFLGIDLGSNSIGYAVTDEEYNLLKLKGKSAWGARLFDEANSAKERRSIRSSRRRMARRKYRIYLLNHFIFGKEIEKVDKTFLLRLNESNLVLEDKSKENGTKYPLFLNKKEEKDYYHKYPTIYHLRKAQINNDPDSFKDIRYLYLSVHHIIKKRGNFLSEGDFNPDSPLTNEMLDLGNNVISNLLKDYFGEDFSDSPLIFSEEAAKEVMVIVLDENSNSREKKSKIKETFIKRIDAGLYKSAKKSFDEIIDLFANTVTGGTKKIDDVQISFNNNYEEKRAEYESVLADKILILDISNAIYNACYIKKTLGEEKYFSFAMVNEYNRHKKDLRLLKDGIVKKLGKDIYHKMFDSNYKEEKDSESKVPSYAKFIESSSAYKYKDAKGYFAFIQNLKDWLNALLKDEKVKGDEELVLNINKALNNINDNSFLKRLSDINNSTFPHQFHEKELDIILNNAKKYFPFLNANDNISKIKSIFLYRVNYYEGPLDTRSIYSNVVKIGDTNEKIYPWNKNQIIDKNKTRINFISKLINECTYLMGEKVLPKNSILFTDFVILNKLNALVINGNKISQEVKKELFDFIKNRNKTSINDIKKFLMNRYDIYKKDGVSLSKIDLEVKDTFVSPIRPLLKDSFNLEDYNVIKEIDEKIIKTLSIYSEDKKEALETIYSMMNLNDAQKKAIKKINCKDWATLSEKFLTYRFPDKNGVISSSIFEILYNSVSTLQEVLNSKEYEILETIQKLNNDFAGNISRKNKIESLINSAPPMTRRPIIQALKIAYDIKKITKKRPTKIMIETTRSNDNEKKRTKSRRENILEFLNAIKSDQEECFGVVIQNLTSELASIEDGLLDAESIYLYFKQLGIDVYTGKKIDLMDVIKTNKYDIDHIIPRSLIKNDSLENKVLVDKVYNENIKSNFYPVPQSIYEQNLPLWKYLLSKNLFSEEKYNALVRRTPLTQEEINQFIARQINVVNYSNIVLRDVFKIAFPKTKLIFQKAENVSFLRNEYNLVKVRNLNDTHHAVDAYFNIVVGDLLDKFYTKNHFISEHYDKKLTFNPESIIKMYFAANTQKLELMKRVYEQKDMILTIREKYSDGGFYDQNITAKPSISGQKELVPVHTNSPLVNVSIYGGRNNLGRSYFVVGKNDKGKKVMISVPIMYLNIKDKELLNEKLCALYSGKNKNIKFDFSNKLFNNSVVTFENSEKNEKYLISLNNKICCLITPLIPLFLDYNSLLYLKVVERRFDAVKRIVSLNKGLNEIVFKRNKKGQNPDYISKDRNLYLKTVILKELEKPERNFSRDKENIRKIKHDYLNDEFDGLDLGEQIKKIIDSIDFFNRTTGNFRLAMDKFINLKPILIKTSPSGIIEKRIKL